MKVTQVCAHMLKIPMEMISIKPSNTLTSPNNMMSGGSITSEACCYATMEACKTLLDRLEPIKEKMAAETTWQELVQQAHEENVELSATHMYSTSAPNIAPYNIIGVCVAEVQLDLLTGEHVVLGVDLLEDAGSSMSPRVDIGQIEGALVMGLGYFTCEKLVYDMNDGRLATYNTWNYKVPGLKDIPVSFRVRMKHNSDNPQGVFNSKGAYKSYLQPPDINHTKTKIAPVLTAKSARLLLKS